MMVFDLFALTDYTFLQLSSGSGGNQVVEEWEASGIFKLRSGMVQVDNTEAYESTSSIHIKPTEPFVATLGSELVGHGVRVTKDGLTAEYRVLGQTEGFDFDTGELDFYRLTLKRESLWETSDLPLE